MEFHSVREMLSVMGDGALVTLKDITEPDPNKAKTLTIDRLPLISLITQLHDSNPDN